MAKNIIERLNFHHRTAIARHFEKNRQCIKLLKENKNQLNESTVSISIQRWINDSCYANIVMNKCSLRKTIGLSNAEREASVCKLVSDKVNHVCKSTDIFKVSTMEHLQEKYDVCCNKDSATVKLKEVFKSKRYKNIWVKYHFL